MIRGLIFDFDGLILDTEVPDYESWQQVFDEHGHELSFDLWADCIGRAAHPFDPATHLEELIGQPIEREVIRLRRRQRYFEMIADKVVLPGVLDYIADAQRLGLRLAVASSSSREWVRGHLERLGLIDHFAAVKSRNDVTHGKPDPELYLAALTALDLRPDEAIAIEDSPNGVTAAKAAGLFCIAVPNLLTGRLPLDHADLRLTSLAELPLERLLASLQTSSTT